MTAYKGLVVPAATDPANVPQSFRDLVDSFGATYASTAAADAAGVPDSYIVDIGGVPMYRNGSDVWQTVLTKPIVGTYSPTLGQGVTISRTVRQATYMRIGDLVTVWVNVQATSAGTSNAAVTCSLPVTATSTNQPVGNGTTGGSSIGAGLLWENTLNASAMLEVWLRSTTQVGFKHAVNTNNSELGNSPSFAVSSQDIIRFHCTYIAA